MAAPPLPVAVDPPAAPQLEAALLMESNEARRRHGQSTLQHDEGLARAARAHAQEMARLGYFSHSSPTPESATLRLRLGRAGVASVTAAENLALLRNQPDVAEAAVSGWLESPSHRAALLNGEYTHVGFGAFEGPAGETFVAQVFARQPRRLVSARLWTEVRQRFDLSLVVEAAQEVTVLARVGGITGEPQTLEAGATELLLSTASEGSQQLVLGAALSGGGFVIQDGGWVTPEDSGWQADGSMPREHLRIARVTSRRSSDAVIGVELEYQPGLGELAVFVDGSHYRGAEVAPGKLRLLLPARAVSRIQVGEVAGQTVLPFDSVTVAPGPGGPAIRAGASY